MLEKIRNTCAHIVVGWHAQHIPFHTFFISALALPLAYFLQMNIRVSLSTLIALTLTTLLLFTLITHLALSREQPPERSACILNKLLGMFIAFLALPLWTKLMAFGFLLFHLIHFAQRSVRPTGFLGRLWDYQGTLGLFIHDIGTGIVVNIFLRLMIWIMH